MSRGDIAIAVTIIEFFWVYDDECADAEECELLHNVRPESTGPDHADARST
jgi:hypothetical protein